MLKRSLMAFYGLVFLAAFIFGQNSASVDFSYKKIKPVADVAKITVFDSRDLNKKYSADVDVDSDGFLKEAVVQQIESHVRANWLNERRYLVFQWVDKEGKSIGDKKMFFFKGEKPEEGSPQQKSGTTTTPPSLDIDKRTAISNEIQVEIDKQAKALKVEAYTALIFDENLNLFFQNRSYGVAGDLIFVAIFHNGLMNLSVEYSPCSLEPESPLLYAGDTSGLSLPQSEGEPETKIFPPRRCFNTSVNIKVKAQKPAGETLESIYPLNQYNRYRGTLQLGVLFTDLHDVTYGLKAAKDKKYIYSKGPVDNGPEYTGSLIIYSILRYVGDLFSREKHFSGRDIVNDRTIMDSLGAVIGVGLTNPGKRFVLGLSFEVAYGINLIGVMEFARVNQLGAGLAEGSEYAGAEETIPIFQSWDHKLVFGLSLDLRYVTALFSRR